jgi:hypothetical protein
MTDTPPTDTPEEPEPSGETETPEEEGAEGTGPSEEYLG